MPNVKLILSDIDGTIMPKGVPSVSQATVDAFLAAQAAGIAAGPASGRAAVQMLPFFRGEQACISTAVATNGLEAYYQGEKICEQHPDRAALRRVMRLVGEIPGAGLVCFHETAPVLVAGSMEDLAAVVPKYAEKATTADDLPDYPLLKVNAFINADMGGTHAFCDRLNAEVDGLDFDVPMLGFTNIMPEGWNKGSAAKALCEHMGIGLDEVVVFGDADNDLAMFSVVENSVAVEGASPNARKLARWHIGRCEDDAVAKAIVAIAAGEWPFSE